MPWALMIWGTEVETTETKLLSPLYRAVMACRPTTMVEVVMLANVPLSGTVPRAPTPSRNVTVPVGENGIEDVGVTVAVKVTARPTRAGLSELRNETVTSVGLTT